MAKSLAIEHYKQWLAKEIEVARINVENCKPEYKVTWQLRLAEMEDNLKKMEEREDG